jgi:hypothetical protein
MRFFSSFIGCWSFELAKLSQTTFLRLLEHACYFLGLVIQTILLVAKFWMEDCRHSCLVALCWDSAGLLGFSFRQTCLEDFQDSGVSVSFISGAIKEYCWGFSADLTWSNPAFVPYLLLIFESSVLESPHLLPFLVRHTLVRVLLQNFRFFYLISTFWKSIQLETTNRYSVCHKRTGPHSVQFLAATTRSMV